MPFSLRSKRSCPLALTSVLLEETIRERGVVWYLPQRFCEAPFVGSFMPVVLFLELSRTCGDKVFPMASPGGTDVVP